MALLIMIMSFSNHAYAFAVRFTFTPSPNIGVNQLAHYQCSVNHTGVGITWNVNGTASSHNDIIQLGIVTNGAGSPNSSLTIPGYPQYNNTVVRCNAFGFVNGNSYFNFSVSILRIQGVLAKVQDLNCTEQDQFCFNCSWSPPFSLVSIPGYIINVTYGGELVTQNTTSFTTWEYCPSQFGTYTISIAGNNPAGEGEINTTSVTLVTVNISDFNVIPIRIVSNWTATCIIKNVTYLEDVSSKLYAYLNPDNTSNSTISPVGGRGYGELKSDSFIGTVNMGKLPDKRKWMMSLSLVHHNGLYINASKLTKFSTFNVQNGSLKSKTKEACFICNFVAGSQSQGCYIEYNSLNYRDNITLIRIPANASTASKCAYLLAGNYTVTFYDLDQNNIPYTAEFAYRLTHQHESGLSATSSSILFSRITDAMMSSHLPCSTCDSVGSAQREISVIIIIGLVVVLVVTLIAISGIIFLVMSLKYFKAKHADIKMIEFSLIRRRLSTNSESLKSPN